ncbi:MAG TPA: hypothetical protein VFK41_01950 [Nocardioidaceae bacterium]|nr:hypothetical protein [Nocardioidaceae bacterium]
MSFIRGSSGGALGGAGGRVVAAGRRTHAGTRVILLVEELQIRIVNAAIGDFLRDLTLNFTNINPREQPIKIASGLQLLDEFRPSGTSTRSVAVPSDGPTHYTQDLTPPATAS